MQIQTRALEVGAEIIRRTPAAGWGDTGTVEAVEQDLHGDGNEYRVLVIRWNSGPLDGMTSRVYPAAVEARQKNRVEALRTEQAANIAAGLTHGGLEIKPLEPRERAGYPEIIPEVIVDGAAIYVEIVLDEDGTRTNAEDTERVKRCYHERGFVGHIVLDGPTGDGTEEVIAVGSIDGDEPVSLDAFADVLDHLGGRYYSVDVLCHDNYNAARSYLERRGYADDVEYSTSY
jgi:hypothetical protein